MSPHPSAVKASPSPTSLSAPSQSLAPPTSRSVAPPPPPPPQLSAQQRRKSAEAAKKKLELQKKTSELLQKQIQQQKVSTKCSVVCDPLSSPTNYEPDNQIWALKSRNGTLR